MRPLARRWALPLLLGVAALTAADRPTLTNATNGTPALPPRPVPVEEQRLVKPAHYPPALVAWVRRVAQEDDETVVRTLNTPLEVAIYTTRVLHYTADRRLYGVPEYWASFRVTNRTKRGDCEDAALAAAAILGDDERELLLLRMYDPRARKSTLHHVVQLLRRRTPAGETYMTLGINDGDILPRASSLEAVISSFERHFKKRVVRYEIYALEDKYSLIARGGGDIKKAVLEGRVRDRQGFRFFPVENFYDWR